MALHARTLLRFAFLVSGFYPLGLAHLAVYWAPSTWLFALGPLAVSMAGTILLGIYIIAKTKTKPTEVPFVKVEEGGKAVRSYIIPFLFPFIGGRASGRGPMVALVIIYIIVIVAYLNTSDILLNPTLWLGGFSLLVARDGDGNDWILISAVRRLSADANDVIILGHNAGLVTHASKE